MLPFLAHDYLYCCHCDLSEGQIAVSLLILGDGFEPGEYEVWDKDNNRYRVWVEGKPKTTQPNATLRRVNAAV